MEKVKVERLDHLGVIGGVIKELGIVEMIDARIVPDDQEEISTGEAVAGMILNGLGFSNRPLSLTPQFFRNKPMDVLFREGVLSDHFNLSADRQVGSSWDVAWIRSLGMGVMCCSARSLFLHACLRAPHRQVRRKGLSCGSTVWIPPHSPLLGSMFLRRMSRLY